MNPYKIYIFLFCIIFSNSLLAQSYEFKNFLITPDAVGPIKKGMTVKEVMDFLPKNQIKKVIGYGEFGDPEYDDFEIYDGLGNHLLTITPYGKADLTREINRVLVLDDRFRTGSNIGLGSNYKDIKKAYPNLNASPDMDVVVLALDELNAWISINKKLLPSDWWDNENKQVLLNKIPLDANTNIFVIWW